jgi:spore maturation protein SpmB
LLPLLLLALLPCRRRMEILIEVILKAGRAGVELALFILLPITVVMLSIMRLLEARGLLDWLVARLAPLLRPFGLTALGVFAALQISLVSFAAPISTLAMMDQRGVSKRHLAATLAMVMAMAQANVSLPMAAMGLAFGPLIMLSVAGGLIAAAVTWYGFGRRLESREELIDESLKHPHAEDAKGVLDVINRAGAEAFRISIGAIPMLVLSLVVVHGLRSVGAIDGLTRLLSPLLGFLAIDPMIVLPALTKVLAGGTAMMGVMDELTRAGQVSASFINQSAGLLINPLDIPGVAILISAGRRVAEVWKAAACGAIIGILARTVGQVAIF